MKKLIVAFLSFISLTTVYAQAAYHLEVYSDCLAAETCLINVKSNQVIKTIPLADYDGSIVGESLSVDSNIADTLHPKAEYCFQGDVSRVCDILGLMAYDNGHFSIKGFSCQISSGEINVQYEIHYDWDSFIEKINLSLNQCQ